MAARPCLGAAGQGRPWGLCPEAGPVLVGCTVIMPFLLKIVSWVSFPQPARHPLYLRTWQGALMVLGCGERRATISGAGTAVSCCHVGSSSVAVPQEEVRPGGTGFIIFGTMGRSWCSEFHIYIYN